MIVKASAKSLRISPRKVGVVAALVRGRTLNEAITILEHTPRRSAQPIKKLIESAKANAMNNFNLVEDSLTLKSISVTVGSRLKRYKPAAHGRALPYEKKSSHVFIEVDGREKPKKTAAKKTETKKESK